MTWNFDVTSAPRGEEKITTTIVDGKERTKREYHVEPVWLAFADGKVKRSYWVPEANGYPARWSGCTAAETPIAWQHFVVPEHPFSNQPETATKSGAVPDPGETAAEGNCRAVTGGESAATISPEEAEDMARYTTRPGSVYLEDVGSGA